MAEDRIRSDGKLAHVWMLGKELGFNSASRLHNTHVCRDCGVLKGAPNFPETACKGIIKITLRKEDVR